MLDAKPISYNRNRIIGRNIRCPPKVALWGVDHDSALDWLRMGDLDIGGAVRVCLIGKTGVVSSKPSNIGLHSGG